jgi:hypothetical protein
MSDRETEGSNAIIAPREIDPLTADSDPCCRIPHTPPGEMTTTPRPPSLVKVTGPEPVDTHPETSDANEGFNKVTFPGQNWCARAVAAKATERASEVYMIL